MLIIFPFRFVYNSVLTSHSTFMQNSFQQQLHQLTTYMRTVIQQGVDISALYIIEAYLTTLKASLKPTAIITSLFSHTQLNKMVGLARSHLSHLQIRQVFYNVNRNRPNDDLILTFKLSFKNIYQNPLKDLSIMAQQILQTLEEWEVITNKSHLFRQKLQGEGGAGEKEEEEVQEQLRRQIELMQMYNNEKELRITESTECLSSLSQNQAPLCSKKIGVQEVTAFYQYITMWSNEIMQEIADFKAVICVTKEESSVDLEQDKIGALSHQGHRYSYPKLKNKQKNEATISHALKKYMHKDLTDKPNSFEKHSRQTLIKQGKQNISKQQEKRLYSLSSMKSTKTLYASKNQKIILSDTGRKQVQRAVKRQVVSERREQGCNRCDIY